MWIPNFFYWGLNQYIVQRTLGSKSLAEGQKGIIFAASLKLIIPFIVVIPGILCFNLYSKDLREEAVKRNADALREMVGSRTVYPFTESFSRTDPTLARQVLSHNAEVAGLPVTVGTDAAPAATWLNNAALLDDVAKNNPAAIWIANAALLDTVAKNNADLPPAGRIETGTKLIGYDYDAAFPTLLRKLLKPGITWFVLASIFGAVVSSLASMLNSASTIATMDIVAKLGHKITKTELSQSQLILSGRVWVVIFVLISCLIAPGLGDPKFGGIFSFIQEFQGFISPGILERLSVWFPGPADPALHGLGGHLDQRRALRRAQVVPRP